MRFWDFFPLTTTTFFFCFRLWIPLPMLILYVQWILGHFDLDSLLFNVLPQGCTPGTLQMTLECEVGQTQVKLVLK